MSVGECLPLPCRCSRAPPPHTLLQTPAGELQQTEKTTTTPCSETQQSGKLEAAQVQVETSHTHSCQTTGAFTYCCTAANQADDEEKSPHGYYYDGRNQSVHVFKEVVIVVVCDKHIGSDVA